ncbi:hypothetical protein Tsubulata_004830 [Turnera subulata]|uniref:Uncharacterized protein n=1 Tax=Turnera subulata TaxID=218843 RepID=A0A9Q0FD71_9ROSI|nr:hypothetical protein Tsubulata_004830 [Turnera subulata]
MEERRKLAQQCLAFFVFTWLQLDMLLNCALLVLLYHHNRVENRKNAALGERTFVVYQARRNVIDGMRNPNKTYKCGTPFPLFNRLAYVFGVDRANGALGELPDEADRALTEFTEGQGEGGADSTFTAQPSNVGQGPNAEQSHTFSETVQTTSGSRKRKRSSDNLNGLAAAIVAGIESYSGYIDKLADAMNGKDPTRVLGEELHKLGLTPNESVQIAMRLSGNAGLTKFYWEMNDDQKREFIKTMMG